MEGYFKNRPLQKIVASRQEKKERGTMQGRKEGREGRKAGKEGGKQGRKGKQVVSDTASSWKQARKEGGG